MNGKPDTSRTTVAELLRWLRSELVSLCEDTEDKYRAIAEHDTEGKPGAFARGRMIEAASIRNAMCEVIRIKSQEISHQPAHRFQQTLKDPE